MTKGFNVPKAKDGEEASMCQYFALCDGDKLKPCTIEPSECVLDQVGIVEKGTFTPVKGKRRCPKVED